MEGEEAVDSAEADVVAEGEEVVETFFCYWIWEMELSTSFIWAGFS